MRKNTDQDNFEYDTFHAVKFVNVLGSFPREIQKFEFDARTNFTEMLMTTLQTHHVTSTWCVCRVKTFGKLVLRIPVLHFNASCYSPKGVL